MAEMNAQETLDYIMNKTKVFFQDRVESFKVDKFMDSTWPEFGFTFRAYKKFDMRLGYDRGSYGFVICDGEYGYRIPSNVQWYNNNENNNIDTLLRDTKHDLELRLPDEYLKENGWL